MTEEEKLKANVAAADATVSDWQARIAGLQTQEVELGKVISKATAVKEGRALSSLLGDTASKAAITSARAQQREAQEELDDIIRYALPGAQEAFAAAEAEAASAHRALTKYHAEIRMRRRIGRAARVDAAIAAFAAELQEFDADGADIANTPDTLPAANMFGTSSIGRLDEITGNRRLRAALAAAFGTRLEKVFPNASYDEKRPETLLDSETRIWNLPPEQPEKKAA